MFLAIIIPPARQNKIIALLVVASMTASFIFTYAPVLSGTASGTRIIILTVAISLIAAILFPIKDETSTEDDITKADAKPH